MIVNNISVQQIQARHINQLFDLSKDALREKGIENIREDILMAGLKNTLAKKYSQIDFGVMHLNTLVGFGFVEITQPIYLERPSAQIQHVYLHPDFRTAENYIKLLREIVSTVAKIGAGTIKTTDDWTLCNDCDVFKTAMTMLANHQTETIYNLEVE